jgi:hypothetical protein
MGLAIDMENKYWDSHGGCGGEEIVVVFLMINLNLWIVDEDEKDKSLVFNLHCSTKKKIKL